MIGSPTRTQTRADIVSDISSDEEEYVNRYLTMPLNVFFGKGLGHIAQYSTIMY